MKQVTCRLDSEVQSLNMYDVAFQHLIGVPIGVQDENGAWIEAGKWTPLSEFISNLQVKIAAYFKRDSIHDRSVYFYAGPDFILEVSWVQLVCAIARAPFDEQQVRRLWGDYWGDWKQHKGLYQVLRETAEDVESWPEFDGSNPDVIAQGETHFQTQLGGYQPHSLRDGSLEANTSVDMILQTTFAEQFRKQVLYPSRGVLLCRSGLSWRLNAQKENIQRHVQQTLISSGEVYLPYIGRFHMKGNRLCFEASRLLRDRIHGRTAPEHRLKNNRAYGGEKQPGQSIQIWGHRDDFQLSRLRQLINAIGRKGVRGTTMIAYQAFSDSLIFRLTQGEHVTIQGVGTLRVNPSKRVSFRTSNLFRKALKEHQAKGEDNG